MVMCNNSFSYKFTIVYCESVNLIGYITVNYLLIVYGNVVTVEPRFSGPQLSGLFDYLDFFPGPVFFMNINKV